MLIDCGGVEVDRVDVSYKAVVERYHDFTIPEAVLKEAGATTADIVRINAYVTGREHLKGYMAARDQFISDPPPASTLMIVGGFSRPEFFVEVEVIAAGPA